ncbi:MAG: potassium channel family protein [bacterium]
MNYAEILFWLALFIKKFHIHFSSKDNLLQTNLGPFYSSLVTMTTLGYGDIVPNDGIGMFISLSQTIIGVFMAIVVITRFIALLPKPGSLDKNEQED